MNKSLFVFVLLVAIQSSRPSSVPSCIRKTPCELQLLGTGPVCRAKLYGHCISSAQRSGVRHCRGRRGAGARRLLLMQQAAEDLGVEIWLPETVNCDEARERLTGMDSRSAGGLRLWRDTQACHAGGDLRLGGINLHGSLLTEVSRGCTGAVGGAQWRPADRQHRDTNDPGAWMPGRVWGFRRFRHRARTKPSGTNSKPAWLLKGQS